MSDHENEHEQDGPPPFAFFLGPTKEQIEQQNMENEANGHETRDFFNSLTLEQLTKLSGIIHAIVHTDGMAGAYYQGIIGATADYKHKKCMACGKDHEKEARDFLTPLNPLDKPVQQVESNERPKSAEEERGNPNDPVGPKGSDKYNENMTLYNMEQDDDGSDRVMCKGCGLWSIDLGDRMLRPSGPSGCEGCKQKVKWG